MLLKLLIYLLFFFSFETKSQILDMLMGTNQNPSNLEWKKIDTKYFEVVYPQELSTVAQKVANTLDHVYIPLTKTINSKPPKISVFLFNQSTESNGMVTLAPRRSEWYITPPATNEYFGNIDWLELLSIHETRHVMQFEKAKRGFTKIAFVMFGEFGQAIFQNIAIPFWVWEGDAVNVESALTSGGRGRLPSFDMALRTLLLNNKPFNYAKAYLGTFKEYYPNHYILGYFLSAYIKKTYGAEKFERTFKLAARKSFNPFSFDNALRKVIHKNLFTLYQDCMRDLTTIYKDQLSKIKLTEAKIIHQSDEDNWMKYNFPQVLEDGTIYALKSGLSTIPKFVKIKDQKETDLLTPGSLYENPFNLSKNYLIWNELEADPRFSQRDFSVISIFDLNTQKKTVLTNKSRYFSPAFSPNEHYISVIENLLNGTQKIKILNYPQLRTIKEFQAKKDETYFSPIWSEDQKFLYAVKQLKNKAMLVRIETNSLVEEVLFSVDSISISRPIQKGNFIYFHGTFSGIDNIYAFNLQNNKIFQVTSRKYGAFNPYVLGNKLYFNDYSLAGYSIAQMDLTTENLIPIDQGQNKRTNYFEPLIKQEQNKDILSEIPQNKYQEVDFSHAENLIETHSWEIFPNPLYNTFDLALYSSNKLSTFGAATGYHYDATENTNQVFAEASYRGIYPIFKMNYNHGQRYSTYVKNGYNEGFKWTETKANFLTTIPYNLSKNNYYHQMDFSFGPSLTEIKRKPVRESFSQNNGQLKSMNYEFEYNHLLKTSLRDLFPRWGEKVIATFHNTPFESDYNSQLLSFNTYLFFPGLTDNHSFFINGVFSHQKSDNYRFKTEYVKPRGYEFIYSEDFRKVSFNYALPLAFIDYNLTDWYYAKRLKQIIFYDFGRGLSTINTNYNSVGMDLLFDSNIFTLKVPFDIGARAVYVINQSRYKFYPIFLSTVFDF